MTIQQLSDEFMTSRRRDALKKALGGEAAIISVYISRDRLRQ